MNEPVKNEIQLFEDQKIRVAWAVSYTHLTLPTT